MGLIFVDCEAVGPCPSCGSLTEFGAVDHQTGLTYHGVLRRRDGSPLEGVSEQEVAQSFVDWLNGVSKSQPVFVSDNPAYDWQWINDLLHRTLGQNPFGHSARRISDFYAGLTGDFRNTQRWKRLRVTPHDHNPVHDAKGNVEAFDRLLAGER